MVFYRRQDAKLAIQMLSSTKDISLATTGPETDYLFRDTWTKAENTEASAVTPAPEAKGTLPMQGARRVFLTPLPRMDDHKMLEDMVRELFSKFKV